MMIDDDDALKRIKKRQMRKGGHGGSIVKLQTPEQEVQGSNPTTAV